VKEAFLEHIHTNFPQLQSGHYLLAISGGVDSVTLAHLLEEANISFALAHCNFNLRGVESDTDAQFVHELAIKFGCSYHVKSFETLAYATDNGISTQMAARDLRYAWFHELREMYFYDGIFTAHHLDDQLETFLINLNRGTGLAGLTGIPNQVDQVLRPLLPFTRSQIENFARTQNLSWREDSSNKSNYYVRNQLRNQILPQLHETLPDLRAHFAQTLKYLQQSKNMVDDSVARFRESVTTTKANSIYFTISQILARENYKLYLFHLFEPYGFVEVDEIDHLLYAESGKVLKNSIYQATKDRDHLIIQKLKKHHDLIGWQLTPDMEKIETPVGNLVIESHEPDDPIEFTDAHHAKNVLLLDKEQLVYPLTLRVWEQGDRIKPYGMQGTKKVSDILIDAKVPLPLKEEVMVLTSDSQVLWVIGLRTSRNHIISKNTKSILKIIWA
jgi:tRNA(Ile)-lysidine synthase